MAPRVLIIGATGNVGRGLVSEAVAAGVDVSAFVRDPAKLASQQPPAVLSRLRVITGDIHDPSAVTAAMAQHDTVIDAASSQDPQEYIALRSDIMTAARESLQEPRRIWVFGGLPGLLVPHTDIPATDLFGMPALFRAHRPNYEGTRDSGLDWTFICPGPMYAARRPGIPGRVGVTFDVMPYQVGAWTRYLPQIVHPFIMYAHLGGLATSYEDVARLVMDNLMPDGPYSRSRIGVYEPQP